MNTFDTCVFDCSVTNNKPWIFFKSLKIPFNAFMGEIDLRTLPKAMISLDLTANTFQGTIHLDSIPSKLTSLILMRNKLEGTLCVQNLPPSLESLNLACNAFFGKFGALPPLPWLHSIQFYAN